MTHLSSWHGIHEVPEDRMITVTVGPLELSIARRPGEWRLGWYRNGHKDGDSGSDLPSASVVRDPGPIVDPESAFTVERFLTHSDQEMIRLRPLLADRPMVARPELPLMVPAGEEVDVFVSTPVWVRGELPDPDRILFEIPTTRPSDTWFGPDTRRGVVAYASQTAARLKIDSLPPMPHRAITPLRIRNQASSLLSLERVSVPAHNLRLYADKDGGLWTASLAVIRDGLSSPQVEISNEPPNEATEAVLVAEPREVTGRSVLSRAFHVLVG